jgi:hypothetical protein
MYVPGEEDTIYCHLGLISLYSFFDVNPAGKSYFSRKYPRAENFSEGHIPSRIMGRGCRFIFETDPPTYQADVFCHFSGTFTQVKIVLNKRFEAIRQLMGARIFRHGFFC